LGKLWGHGGTISGFSTDMWYMPEEDATIVISVNRSDETMDNRSNAVLLAVLTSLFPETLQSL
jgi:D-alanyl-D-alanine carboxypeptidase